MFNSVNLGMWICFSNCKFYEIPTRIDPYPTFYFLLTERLERLKSMKAIFQLKHTREACVCACVCTCVRVRAWACACVRRCVCTSAWTPACVRMCVRRTQGQPFLVTCLATTEAVGEPTEAGAGELWFCPWGWPFTSSQRKMNSAFPGPRRWRWAARD